MAGNKTSKTKSVKATANVISDTPLQEVSANTQIIVEKETDEEKTIEPIKEIPNIEEIQKTDEDKTTEPIKETPDIEEIQKTEDNTPVVTEEPKQATVVTPTQNKINRNFVHMWNGMEY